MATDDSAVQARLEEGATLYEDGNLYEALVAWKEVLALDPDNEVAQEYLSFVEENFQIGVDALLAHHEAALGAAPPVGPPPPPPSKAPASAAQPPPPPSKAPASAAQPPPAIEPAPNPAVMPPIPESPSSDAPQDGAPMRDTQPKPDSTGASRPESAVVSDAPLDPPSADVAHAWTPPPAPAPPASDALAQAQSLRPPARAPLPSEPALPLDPPGLDSDAPVAFTPLALAPSASIEDLPEGLPSSSVDVPLFADPDDFMQAPPPDLPAAQRAPADPPPADQPASAEVDPLAGLDPLLVASNVDAAFDALLAPAEESVEASGDDDDAAPVSLPLPSVLPIVDELAYDAADDAPMTPVLDAVGLDRLDEADSSNRSLPGHLDEVSAAVEVPFGAEDGTAFDDPGAPFDDDEGIPFEPDEGAPEAIFRAIETPPGPVADDGLALLPSLSDAIAAKPSARRPSGPIRVTPPQRRESPALPMRGEPRDSGVRQPRSGRPSQSGERPFGTAEHASQSGERLPGSVERPIRSRRPSGSIEHPTRSQRPSGGARQNQPGDSQEGAGRGHSPVDSIEEMDWSEILEEGVAQDAVPTLAQPDADEAFFVEMRTNRLDVEPGNEAAAWGARGSPISAPIVQHRSAPTRDPFVMPASHFVDLPDEVFTDEPSIPDTWAAEAPEADELSDGSIDIMVEKDFESWDQPIAPRDPFAQSHGADDAWGAAADAFDVGAAPDVAEANKPALPSPGLSPDPSTNARLSESVEALLEQAGARRTTQELVSPPTPPMGFDAKPPPVAHQTPTSLPPLPGEPDDGPVYGAGDDDPLAAGEAPDWLSPTFEPGPAEPESGNLPDAFAPPEGNAFEPTDDASADAFSRADTPTKDMGVTTGSILIETRTSIGEAPTLELPDASALLRGPLPDDPPLPGDEQPAAAAMFGRKRRGGAVDRGAVADARRQEKTPPTSPIIDIDPDIEALLRSGFEDLDAIESTGSQSLEVRQRVPSRPAHDVDLDELMEQARQKQGAGDFTGSLELVEQVLLAQPENPRAQAYMQENTSRLLDMYRSRLGPLTRMPRVKLRPEEIIWQALDHRAGFLLSQVDGRTSYEDLIEIAGMSELEATRTLARLVGYELIG